jgi:hypothetical protein
VGDRPAWAAISVFVATSPLFDGVGGRYFVDCNAAGVGERSATIVAAHALDPKEADRFCQVSGSSCGGEN